MSSLDDIVNTFSSLFRTKSKEGASSDGSNKFVNPSTPKAVNKETKVKTPVGIEGPLNIKEVSSEILPPVSLESKLSPVTSSGRLSSSRSASPTQLRRQNAIDTNQQSKTEQDSESIWWNPRNPVEISEYQWWTWPGDERGLGSNHGPSESKESHSEKKDQPKEPIFNIKRTKNGSPLPPKVPWSRESSVASLSDINSPIFPSVFTNEVASQMNQVASFFQSIFTSQGMTASQGSSKGRGPGSEPRESPSPGLYNRQSNMSTDTFDELFEINMKYEIVQYLGKGAYGKVYEAIDR